MVVNLSIAQVGINTIVPHASAELDVTSSSRGLLVPRLSTTAINALTSTASEGLIVFNTTTKQFLGFNGTSWQAFTTTNAALGTAQTATFASWEVNGYSNGGGSPQTATATSQISAANLQRGSGLTTGAAGNAWGGSGFDTAADATAAISNNDFFTVNLTLPTTGVFFSFTKISAYNIRRSSTGPTNFQWQYSINGGAFTNIGSVVNAGSDTNANPGNPMPEITLSSIAALQNLPTTTTSVVFRIVPYGASATGGTFYINNIPSVTGNDLEIIGTYQ